MGFEACVKCGLKHCPEMPCPILTVKLIRTAIKNRKKRQKKERI
jgi:hypothetical protein